MANVPAARQALAVLGVVGRSAAPVPAAAVARELGLPRSSVYHLLGALVDAGYVVHVADEQRFGLGPAAFELGFAYQRQQPLRWIAQTTLARLVDSTTVSGHFAVLDGADVLYLIEERAPGRASLVTDVGVRLPAHLTASGLAMLAALTPEQVSALYPTRRALVRRHAAGPRSVTALRRALATVRADGWAQEDGSVTPGFASVAAAVLDHRARPAAAVALTFPGDALDTAGRALLATRVQRAAARIAHQISGGASR